MLAAGWLLTTKILVNVILPVLVTVPVKTSGPPSVPGVTRSRPWSPLICGAVTNGTRGRHAVVDRVAVALVLAGGGQR